MIKSRIYRTALLATVLLWVSPIFAQSVFDMSEELSFEKSVVLIRATHQGWNYVTPWKMTGMGRGVGSGLIIDGRRILTNAHNVADWRYVEIKKQNIARWFPATVEFVGHDCDLALLRVDNEQFWQDTVPLALGGIPRINSTVHTYGFPLGGQRISITEGVVSRIQTDVYSHSRADSHLVIQTDAAINPGNSGGPVLQNNKVVGVAFQGMRDADNIGYLIPTTVIRHFLEDVEDGQYNGFGSVGFTYFPGLHNPSYKKYLQIPAGEDGIIVLDVMLNSSIEGLLQKEDVITAVDDYDIDDDGNIWVYGLKLSMSEAIEQKQIGENIVLTFYRDGEKHEVEAKVAVNRPVLEYARRFDDQPEYYVFGGLTFVTISRNYLEEWGRNWTQDIPFYMRYLFEDNLTLNQDPQREEYVVLSEILPDPVNSYLDGFQHQVVESVNEQNIMSLEQLAGIFQTNQAPYCRIQFMGNPVPLILDYQEAQTRNKIIFEKYQIPSPSNLEEDS